MKRNYIEECIEQHSRVIDFCENRCNAIWSAKGLSSKWITNGEYYFDKDGFYSTYVNTYDYKTTEGSVFLSWEQIEMSDTNFNKFVDKIKFDLEEAKKKKVKQEEELKYIRMKAQYEQLKQELKEKGKI